LAKKRLQIPGSRRSGEEEADDVGEVGQRHSEGDQDPRSAGRRHPAFLVVLVAGPAVDAFRGQRPQHQRADDRDADPEEIALG
jgi:hypothetical protein